MPNPSPSVTPSSGAAPSAVRVRRPARRWLLGLLAVVFLSLALLAAYVQVALRWSYSDGERAGYVQKFSRKGWICKTWEGEMALVSMPGTVAEKFYFSVPDDAIAQQINDSVGQRVSLTYQQHIGIPTTCFADTQYFVDGVQVIPGAGLDASRGAQPQTGGAPPVP
jgi:hypothetical protein